jgi:hypothetical protein
VTAAICSHPAHEGSRLVERRSLLEERTEWRDVVTQSRFLVRTRRRVCRDCARCDVARIDGVHPEQEAML